MNVEFVLKLVKPYLKNNILSEVDFEKIFNVLDLHEKYSVIDVLIANNIEVAYDEQDSDINLADEGLPKEEDYEQQLINRSFITTNPNQINLSNEQLCVLYQKGDESALDLLYIKNKRFIWKLARKAGNIYNHKLDDEDLVSYGFFGLRKAALRFEPSMENKFITYAGHWISSSIMRAIADFGFTIRVPVHMFENINYINRIDKEMHFESEQELISYICSDKGVEESKAREWLVIAENILKPASLNVFVGENEDSELMEFVQNDEPSVEEQVEYDELRNEILKCLDQLQPRQAEVLKMRFGFEGDGMTLEEVGKYYKVTRERIRQIEAKAIKKLAKLRNVKELKVFLED